MTRPKILIPVKDLTSLKPTILVFLIQRWKQNDRKLEARDLVIRFVKEAYYCVKLGLPNDMLYRHYALTIHFRKYIKDSPEFVNIQIPLPCCRARKLSLNTFFSLKLAFLIVLGVY